MEINSFNTFEKLLTEAQARRDTLGQEIKYLEKVRADKIASFDKEVASGKDPEELHELIELLSKKIDTRKKEWETWDSSISGRDNKSLIYEAAQDAFKEGTDILNKELRREWNSAMAQLEEAKKAYLALCAKLGSIHRKAEEISDKLASGLDGFLPASGVPRLATGIDLEELTGPIFLDHNAIKKAYHPGGK
jgi:Ribonuclease G/E